MYPPPPRFPASGYVTASANPTATAASTAFPPRRKISTPAALASESLLDTIALGANDARPPLLSRHAAGNVALCEGVAVDCGDGARHVASATIENDRTARDVANHRYSGLRSERRTGRGDGWLVR